MRARAFVTKRYTPSVRLVAPRGVGVERGVALGTDPDEFVREAASDMLAELDERD